MDECETIARDALRNMGYSDIKYEPDGNIPPDFLIDGRIAVEVRRLNQNQLNEEGYVGFEQVAIPVWNIFKKQTSTAGYSNGGPSFGVFYKFNRPLPSWKIIENKIKSELDKFYEAGIWEKTKVSVCDNLSFVIFPLTEMRENRFYFFGGSDRDSGGWLLDSLKKNIDICINEKSEKIEKYRGKYTEWWLVLVDNIAYGMNELDQELFFDNFSIVQNKWDKIILLGPRNTDAPIEIK